jgi:hypothetical protein
MEARSMVMLDPEFSTANAIGAGGTRPVDHSGRYGALALLLPNGQRRSLARSLTVGSAGECELHLRVAPPLRARAVRGARGGA